MSTSTDTKPSKSLNNRKMFKPENRDAQLPAPSFEVYKETRCDHEKPYPSDHLSSSIYFDDSLTYNNQNDKYYNKHLTIDHVGTSSDLQTLCTSENMIVNECKEIYNYEEPELKKYFPLNFVC